MAWYKEVYSHRFYRQLEADKNGMITRLQPGLSSFSIMSLAPNSGIMLLL